MEKMQLTFPVFYHCAIKGASELQQYKCVNILLNGFWQADSPACLSEQLVSRYVSGSKRLTKFLTAQLLSASDEELSRRFSALNMGDISHAVQASVHLLEQVEVSLPAKNELLSLAATPDGAYRFLGEMLRTAVRNTAATQSLTKDNLSVLETCRSGGVRSPFDSCCDLLRVRKMQGFRPTPAQTLEAYFYETLGRTDSPLRAYHANIAENLAAADPAAVTIYECTGTREAILQYLPCLPDVQTAPLVLGMEMTSQIADWEDMIDPSIRNLVETLAAPKADVFCIGGVLQPWLREGEICLCLLMVQGA